MCSDVGLSNGDFEVYILPTDMVSLKPCPREWHCSGHVVLADSRTLLWGDPSCPSGRHFVVIQSYETRSSMRQQVQLDLGTTSYSLSFYARSMFSKASLPSLSIIFKGSLVWSFVPGTEWQLYEIELATATAPPPPTSPPSVSLFSGAADPPPSAALAVSDELEFSTGSESGGNVAIALDDVRFTPFG